MLIDALKVFATAVSLGSGDPAPATEAEPPEYVIPLTIHDCVPLDDGDGDTHSEKFFGYGLGIHFESYEDLSAFRSHPQREEIENSITEYMRENGRESLKLEIERDLNIESYPDAGPDTLNEGTIGDLEVTLDDIILQMNKTYDINISSGEVFEESGELDICIYNYPSPNEFAVVDPDASDTLPGIGMGMGKSSTS